MSTAFLNRLKEETLSTSQRLQYFGQSHSKALSCRYYCRVQIKFEEVKCAHLREVVQDIPLSRELVAQTTAHVDDSHSVLVRENVGEHGVAVDEPGMHAPLLPFVRVEVAEELLLLAE